MSGAANAVRGEASILVGGVAHVLRPTFAALVRAEEEVGSLLRFVEKVAGGDAKLAEIAALLWHCVVDQDALSREKLGEAIVEAGLAAVTPLLKTIVTQILKGR